MSEFRFGVDLIELSKRHVAFLQAVHAAGLSLNRPSAESCRRYELWLRFAAKFPGESLVPPSDVAWMWHCHRLAPYRYAEYCRDIFDAPVEAHPPFSMQHAASSVVSHEDNVAHHPGLTTRKLWAKEYPEEQFFLDTNATKNTDPAPAGAGVFAGFDVLASAERQTTFLWQVSGPRYVDEEFLLEALHNYQRFVMLMAHKDKSQILVPTYQIDLMWHTHMLANFAAYDEDCIELMGHTLNHDGTLNRAYTHSTACKASVYDDAPRVMHSCACH